MNAEVEKNKKILIVEDSSLTIEIIAEYLHKNGYETLSVSSGEKAIKTVQDFDDINLILMDIMLEGKIDGVEAANKILEIKDVPIVFITANVTNEIVERVKSVKAYGFIQKGVKKAAMLSTVEMALKLFESNMQEKMKEITLSAIMNASQNSIIMYDKNKNIIFSNKAAQNFFNLESNNTVGKNLNDIFLSYEYVGECNQNVILENDILKENVLTSKIVEIKAYNKKNKTFFIELSTTSFKINGVWYGLILAQDITNRKIEQEELKKSRKEYLELAENSPVGVLKCDVDGNIIYINKKAIEILGSPSVEQTKKINLIKFPLMVKYGLSKQLLESMKTKEVKTIELEYKTKWGKYLWLRTHTKPTEDEGVITGAQIIIDDITEKKLLEEKFQRLCVTDELTNTYNRRFMKEKLQEEIKKCTSDKYNFSLIMFDVDNFKEVNDCYGHDIGDKILEKFSSEIKKHIKGDGILARWGGEEFLVLLPKLCIKKATNIAEYLRKHLSQIKIPEVATVTASFGVASYKKGDTIYSIVKRADNMMYKAKAAGRNCVCSEDSCSCDLIWKK